MSPPLGMLLKTCSRLLKIIDSIMALFRVDFSGRGELSERQQKLAQMLSKLSKLSEEFNVRPFLLSSTLALLTLV